MKKCNVCNQNKFTNNFSISHSICKICRAKDARERRKWKLEDFDFSSIASRFWEKVKKTDSCWLWMAGTNKYGYGKFFINGKDTGSHRISYMLSFGFVSKNVFICHTCDNPPCVKLDHLFLSTPQGNMDDKVKKRRHMYGNNHTNAKITKEDVRVIKRRYLTEKISQSKLGEEYGVHQAHISKILCGKVWQL